jgi:hypothetical protein
VLGCQRQQTTEPICILYGVVAVVSFVGLLIAFSIVPGFGLYCYVTLHHIDLCINNIHRPVFMKWADGNMSNSLLATFENRMAPAKFQIDSLGARLLVIPSQLSIFTERWQI